MRAVNATTRRVRRAHHKANRSAEKTVLRMITGSPEVAAVIAEENDLSGTLSLNRPNRPQRAWTDKQGFTVVYPWDLRHEMAWWNNYGVHGLTGDEFTDWDGYVPSSYVSYPEALAYVAGDDRLREREALDIAS